MEVQREPDLAQIALAARRLSLGLGTAQRREQQRRQDRDDRDHHQQLDQREAPDLTNQSVSKRCCSPSNDCILDLPALMYKRMVY